VAQRSDKEIFTYVMVADRRDLVLVGGIRIMNNRAGAVMARDARESAFARSIGARPWTS